MSHQVGEIYKKRETTTQDRYRAAKEIVAALIFGAVLGVYCAAALDAEIDRQQQHPVVAKVPK